MCLDWAASCQDKCRAHWNGEMMKRPAVSDRDEQAILHTFGGSWAKLLHPALRQGKIAKMKIGIMNYHWRWLLSRRRNQKKTLFVTRDVHRLQQKFY